jgi:hypothetical protein
MTLFLDGPCVLEEVKNPRHDEAVRIGHYKVGWRALDSLSGHGGQKSTRSRSVCSAGRMVSAPRDLAFSFFRAAPFTMHG